MVAFSAMPATPTSSSPTPIRTAIAGANLPLSAPPIPEARNAPAASHSNTSPELIGDSPRTFWSQSGIAKRIPNSPIEMIAAAMEPFLKDPILNRSRSSKTFFFSLSRFFSQITNATVAITEINSATGITEIPSVGQTKPKSSNWLLGFISHQP